MCRVRMLLEHVSCRRALMADGSCGQVTVLALPRHVTYVLASRHLTAQSGEGIWSGMSVRVARGLRAWPRGGARERREPTTGHAVPPKGPNVRIFLFFTPRGGTDAPNGPRQTRRDGASSAFVPSQNGFSNGFSSPETSKPAETAPARSQPRTSPPRAPDAPPRRHEQHAVRRGLRVPPQILHAPYTHQRLPTHLHRHDPCM